jgi:alpha-D-ribose 1-methylphosphonate 5-triphosphate synthase subunit PhnH
MATTRLAVERLAPGFVDPVADAQACFRALLTAFAHPGRIVALPVTLAAPPPAPLDRASAAALLTLLDLETPVWLAPTATGATDYLRFHCGCPLVEDPARGQFGFVPAGAAIPPLDEFDLGTDEYPDRAATLLLAVPALHDEGGVRLTGPGIAEAAHLSVGGLPGGFWTERADLGGLFPRGLDLLFTSGDRVVAVPRSTRVEA